MLKFPEALVVTLVGAGGWLLVVGVGVAPAPPVPPLRRRIERASSGGPNIDINAGSEP